MSVGRYLSLPFLVVAVILQSTLMPELQVRGGRADLLFMLVLSWTLLAGTEEGIVWALVGGALQDLVTGMPVGTSALALVIVMYGVGLVIRDVGRANVLIPPLAAGGGTAVYHLLLMGLYAVLGRPASLGYNLLNVTLPTVLFNTILVLPVFRVMGVVFEASRPRRVTL